ncbi:Alanine racemase [compost metagenome]
MEAGASDLGVAFLDEALEILEAGIRARIVILGHTSVEAVEVAIRNDVAITVFTEETMSAISACCEKNGLKARVHLKIDTGMTRLGVASVEEAYRLASQAMTSGSIELEGIFTHFADADNKDDTFTRIQFGKFMVLVAELERRNIHIPLKHCCNSAATVKFPEMHLDMVRIGMYGLLPLLRGREAALTMIDVTRVPGVCIGDDAMMFGDSQGHLLVDEIAQRMRSINYEVVCNVGKRVPRVYRTKLY